MRFYLCILQSCPHFKKPIWSFKNAATAISLAALMIHGMLPPFFIASIAIPRFRKVERIRFFKVSAAYWAKIKSREIRSQSLWIAKCILNGKFHIRQSHLRFHRSILKLNDTMYNTLRVYNYIDLIGCRLNNQRASIISRPLFMEWRGINGDFAPISPVGDASVPALFTVDKNTLSFPGTDHRMQWGKFFNRIVPFASHALKDGRMFRVDRINIHSFSLARAVTSSPATTNVSCLPRAMCFPALLPAVWVLIRRIQQGRSAPCRSDPFQQSLPMLLLRRILLREQKTARFWHNPVCSHHLSLQHSGEFNCYLLNEKIGVVVGCQNFHFKMFDCFRTTSNAWVPMEPVEPIVWQCVSCLTSAQS